MAEWGFARRQRARPGGRRGRPGDLRTCGLADLRTCGLADLRTCGLADLRTCGLADLRTCATASEQRAGLRRSVADLCKAETAARRPLPAGSQTCAKTRQPRAAPPGRVTDLCKDETAARRPFPAGRRLVQSRRAQADRLAGSSTGKTSPGPATAGFPGTDWRRESATAGRNNQQRRTSSTATPPASPRAAPPPRTSARMLPRPAPAASRCRPRRARRIPVRARPMG
jgi:hypothetical protein